jgi:hypothetical protein
MEINFKTKEGLDQFTDLVYGVMVRCYNEHIKPDMEESIDERFNKLDPDSDRIDVLWELALPFKIGKFWLSGRRLLIVIIFIAMLFIVSASAS